MQRTCTSFAAIEAPAKMPLGEKYDSLRLSPARWQPQSAYQQPARRRCAACWTGCERVQAGLCCGCQGAAVERGRCRYAGLDGSRLCTRAGSAGHAPGEDVWRGMTVESTWHLNTGLGSPRQQSARRRALQSAPPRSARLHARSGARRRDRGERARRDLRAGHCGARGRRAAAEQPGRGRGACTAPALSVRGAHAD